MVHNTSKPNEFFNSIDLGASHRFFKALPKLFVNIGLFLTFFGLAAALYIATDGIRNLDVDMTKSVSDLLYAASFKFLTSLAGLLSSIILGAVISLFQHVINRLCHEICHDFDHRLVYSSPNSIEQNMLLGDIRDNMKVVAENIKGIPEGLSDNLNNAIEPLHNAAQSLFEDMKEQSQSHGDALKAHIQEAVAVLPESLNNFVEKLNEFQSVVEGNAEAYQTSMESIQGSFGNIQVGFDQTDKNLQNTFKEIERTMELQADGQKQLLGTIEQLKVASEMISENVRSSQGTNQALVNACQSVKDACSQLLQHSNDLELIKSAISHSQNSVVTNHERFREKTSEFVHMLSEQLDGYTEALRDGLYSLHELVDNFVEAHRETANSKNIGDKRA